MKRFFLIAFGTLLFAGVANGQSAAGGNNFTPLPKPKAGEAIATFGGGCFWSMSEAMSELKGVNKVISGYAGGATKNPTYDQVATLTTGHAECSQIYYDPKVISFTTLANAFFLLMTPQSSIARDLMLVPTIVQLPFTEPPKRKTSYWA